MLKKLVSLALLFGLALPASAHVTEASDRITVYKFEIVSGQPTLIRSYKRKWGEIVLSAENKELINYLSRRIYVIAKKELYITEIALIDDQLSFVYLKSVIGALNYRIQVGAKQLCVENPSTEEYETCIK